MTLLRRVWSWVLPTYEEERTYYLAHGRYPAPR